jgi:hypothetical protein
MAEMPLLEEMHKKFPGIPILVIHGTALGSFNEIQVGTILTNNNYTFTVPLDTLGQVSAAYSITSIPKTFFIDSTGIIQKIQDGSFSSLSGIESMYNSY